MVTCVRHSASGDTYFVLGQENGTVRNGTVKSESILNLGEAVEVDTAVWEAKLLEGEQGRLAEELRRGARAFAKQAAKEKPYESGVAGLDKITGKMWPGLRSAAELLVEKLVYSAPVVARFHNDIDGSSGAYAVYKAVQEVMKGAKANIVWRMHRGISYAGEDMSSDAAAVNNYESVEKPLLLLIDFGTSTESNEGIEAAKDRFDMIWLDHHPVVEGFRGKEIRNYVNPWLFGGDSNYTAGFLSCAMSHAFSDINTKEIEHASLIGDYSEYSRPTDASRELASLLDLVTSDVKLAGSGSENLSPETIDSLLGDEKKRREMIGYAESRVNELLDTAIRSVKVHRAGNVNVYVADFEKARGENHEKYPLPGRFASRLLDKIEELNKEACILVMHFGPYISIRLSKKMPVHADVLRIINAIKEEHANYVEAGGGHANAASIKLKDENGKNTVIKALLNMLKLEIEAERR